MKKLTIVLALLAMTLGANAQTTPTPEFKNKVMLVDKSNALTDLEKTDLTTSLKTNMGGHSEVNIVADGKAATLMNSGSPAEKFVVKIEPGVDPETVVELFTFDVAKKVRKILVAQMSMGKDQAVTLTKVKLNYTKIADGVYAVSVKEQLPEGQYCFLVNRPNITIMGSASAQSLIGYCFGVAGK